MNVIAQVIVAREALEVGDDSVAYKVLIDLEADLEARDSLNVDEKFRCGCGAAFRWPGELDHHRYAAGHGVETRAA